MKHHETRYYQVDAKVETMTHPTLPWFACVQCGLHISVPEEWRSLDMAIMSRRVVGAHRKVCTGKGAQPRGVKPPKRLRPRRVKKQQRVPVAPDLVEQVVSKLVTTLLR